MANLAGRRMMAEIDGDFVVYGNMPPFGLGKAGRLIPLAEAKTARDRFRAAASGPACAAG